MGDDFLEENEDFADMLTAVSYQDSVSGVTERKQRELHRNVWEFWQIMRGEESRVNASVRKTRRTKIQQPADLSYGEKKAQTAWRIFYFDLAIFVLSCILGWKILMFICTTAVSQIYTWSILPKHDNFRRYKFHDFALLFLLNTFWIALILCVFWGNAFESA